MVDCHSGWTKECKAHWVKNMATGWVEHLRDEVAEAVAKSFPGSEKEYDEVMSDVLSEIKRQL